MRTVLMVELCAQSKMRLFQLFSNEMQDTILTLPAGAMDAGQAVGGIRILREAGTSVRSASYLPADAQVFCRFLAPRKVLTSR